MVIFHCDNSDNSNISDNGKDSSGNDNNSNIKLTKIMNNSHSNNNDDNSSHLTSLIPLDVCFTSCLIVFKLMFLFIESMLRDQ